MVWRPGARAGVVADLVEIDAAPDLLGQHAGQKVLQVVGGGRAPEITGRIDHVSEKNSTI